MMLILCNRRVAIATVSLTLITLSLATNFAPNDPTVHGLTVFHKIDPTEAQIKAFSTGDFEKAPDSAYECIPDPKTPYHKLKFSCRNPALSGKTITPQDIYDYGNPKPDCLSSGVTYEPLQWATWSHACWTRPSPAINTPMGHAEASFESTALAFRFLVLYQHNKHLLALNKAIAELRLAADTELLVMSDALAKNTLDIDTYYDEEIAKLPEHGGDHRNRWIKFNEEREQKKTALKNDSDQAMSARESMFWKDSWVYREKTVKLDHCVGDYFERWMSGQTQGGWDWAGMGEPDPAFPVNFRVP